MVTISKDSVTYLDIDEEMVGQRLDNLLSRLLKGVPKSHLYRIIRSGEIRINKGRVSAEYRVLLHDRLRIPPIRIATSHYEGVKDEVARRYHLPILYEDESLLVIDKPAGLAVHGGSGVSFGLIELIRKQRPHAAFLELVHRLDRETSGVIMIAKKRSALVALHEMMRANQFDKRYLALVNGIFPSAHKGVKLPLLKYLLPNGERRVRVAEEGVFAHTLFTKMQDFSDFSLLEAQLKTGRTHQIRVHLAHMGLPILGDDKYGSFELNKVLGEKGLNRMFLHAHRLSFHHPITHALLELEAPLPAPLQNFLGRLHIE